MTPPEFEISMSDKSSPESIHNFHVLSNRFSELEKIGEKLLLKNTEVEQSEATRFRSDNNDELYIYPKAREWYLNKEQDLNEGSFSLLGTVNVIPFINENGEILVLMSDNNFEDIKLLPLSKKRYSSIDTYYYGLRGLQSSEVLGDYSGDKEDYNNVKGFLEELTGLKINEFYIGLSRIEDSREAGQIQEGGIQFSIDLK